MNPNNRKTQTDLTVAGIADAWCSINEHIWTEAHRRSTRKRLDRYIIPHWGDTLIGDIKLIDLQTWFANLRKLDGEPMAPSSLRSYKASFSGLFSFALEHQYVDRNLCDHIKLPKMDARRQLPDTESIKATLARIDDPAWSAFFHLSAITGARRAELCGLRWEDIGTKSMQIRRSVSATGRIQRTKTANSDREVPLPELCVDLLEQLWDAREYHSPQSYIFSTNPNGDDPLRPDTPTKVWAENRRDRSITLHDLRHHAASQMLGAGIDVVTVAAILGQDPSTTLRVYAHAIPQNTSKAIDLLAELFTQELDRPRRSDDDPQTPGESSPPQGSPRAA